MKARMVAVLCVGALVLAGCGTRSTGAEGNPTDGGGAPPPSGSDVPAQEDGFGTLANPCGPNTSGTPNTASAPGVTEDEIVVTTISDPGGVRPGLNQGIFDSMVAFGEWCNSFGGINGRKLTVVQRDAKIFEYLQRISEACTDSFALVGGLGVSDDQGAQASVDCGLVNVPAAAVSVEQASAENVYLPMPNPLDTFATGSAQWVKDRFPGVEDEAAMIYVQVPSVRVQAERRQEGYTKAGYTWLSVDAANVTETNWGPLIAKMKDEGAEYVTSVSSFEELVPMQKAMAAQGFSPTVTELETNFYNAKYPVLAKEQGAQVDSTYVRLTTWPFEEADARPAMRTYLDLLEQYAPGAQPEQLGVPAFSAGLLFATAAKAAGNDLTRERLVEELQKIHDWDAGGLHGTTDPGNDVGTSCFVMMQVTYEGFVRAYPLPDQDREVYEAGDGMACPTDALVELEGDFGGGADGSG